MVAVFIFASLYGWFFRSSKDIPCKRALKSLAGSKPPRVLTAGSVEYRGKRYYQKSWHGMPTIDLRNRGIRDIAEVHGLAGSVGLQALRLDHNNLAQLHGLEHLQTIRVLTLRKNHLGRELTGGLLPPALEFLDLSLNGVEDLTQLGHLPNLRVLDLTGNMIAEIKGLENLPNLRVLDARDNPMKRIGDLAHPSLEVIHIIPKGLGDNTIKSIGKSMYLPMLRELGLNGGWILGIPGISGISAYETFLRQRHALESKIFLPFELIMLVIIITSIFLAPALPDLFASFPILLAFLFLRAPSRFSSKLIQKCLTG